MSKQATAILYFVRNKSRQVEQVVIGADVFHPPDDDMRNLDWDHWISCWDGSRHMIPTTRHFRSKEDAERWLEKDEQQHLDFS